MKPNTTLKKPANPFSNQQVIEAMCIPPYIATKDVIIVFNGKRWERHRKLILRSGYGNEAPGHQWRDCGQEYKFRWEAITASHDHADNIIFAQEIEEQCRASDAHTIQFKYVVKFADLFLEYWVQAPMSADDKYTFSKLRDKAITFPTWDKAQQVAGRFGGEIMAVKVENR